MKHPCCVREIRLLTEACSRTVLLSEDWRGTNGTEHTGITEGVPYWGSSALLVELGYHSVCELALNTE
jgi:hypothetical protein